MKRTIISLALVLAMLLSLAVPTMAVSGTFTDISDPAVAQDVETLRLLGVVDGMADGKFEPDGTLTRAQFCKMAVVMMGAQGQEPAFRSRTIFSDVTSTHWARGYINLAASGAGAIISGMGNGKFSPDTEITYAQAVTILVRLLGYSDSDTNMQWPEGYFMLADELGLTNGLVIGDNASISRAQAAQLFCAMLGCRTKGGSPYLARFGSVVKDVILLSTNAVAADGTAGALYTSAGTYKTLVQLNESYLGERGSLVVNENGYAVLFIPGDSSRKTVTVQTAEASWFRDSAGTRYAVPSATVVYTGTENKTWGDIWLDLAEGDRLTLYFTAGGAVEALYYATSDASDRIAVAMDEVKGNPFTSLLKGATNYTIYKNGAEVSVEQLQRYDVAEYDPVAAVLRVNDFKLTGYYENAQPGPASPETIWLLGQSFEVLPMAQESLAQFKLGDRITLLFTADLKVAGVVSPQAVSSKGVGIVKSWTADQVTVELFAGRTELVLSGKPGASSVTALTGEPVTISCSRRGYLDVYQLESEPAAALDLEAMTLGSRAVSPAARIYDRAGKSALLRVELSELSRKQYQAAEVLFVHTDATGAVDMLVLNDVSGDCYTYGFLTLETYEEYSEFGPLTRRTATVRNSTGATPALGCYTEVTSGQPYGVAANCRSSDVAALVTLQKLEKVSRSAFRTEKGVTTLTVNGLQIPVAEDVQCYNATADLWFKSLNEARAFSSTLTVYYDRDPALGGKVRLVVA